MGKEVALTDDGGRKKRSDELYLWLLELKQAGRELVLDTAEALREVRDGAYYGDYGYDSIEALAKGMFGLEKSQAYKYIQIAENVVGELPEWAANVLVHSVENSGNPLPLKVLAALHFDHVDPKELEKIRKMEPDQQKVELLRLGYDRDRMGGRAASDLMRPYVSRKKNRDQSREMGRLREQRDCAREEKAEVVEQYKALQARLDQVLAAIENPQAAKVVKQIDAMAARLGELEKAKAEVEAKIATGREVEGRALEFIGQTQSLVRRFYDSCVPDTVDGWIAVHDGFETSVRVLLDARAKMAEDLVEKMAEGKVEKFDPEDPRMLRDLAASRMKPGRK